MEINHINTFGELKKSGYKSISIKEELRNNLINNIKNKMNGRLPQDLLDVMQVSHTMSNHPLCHIPHIRI